MSRSKDIGTQAETAVVNWLRENGFQYAERRALHGSTDLGDITGTPGVAWEVKAGVAAATASDGKVLEWLEETNTERINAHCDFGVLVMKRNGIGYARAGEWWAVLPAWQVVELFSIDNGGLVQPPRELWLAPVRLHLDRVVHALRYNGYGDPL